MDQRLQLLLALVLPALVVACEQSQVVEAKGAVASTRSTAGGNVQTVRAVNSSVEQTVQGIGNKQEVNAVGSTVRQTTVGVLNEQRSNVVNCGEVSLAQSQSGLFNRQVMDADCDALRKNGQLVAPAAGRK